MESNAQARPPAAGMRIEVSAERSDADGTTADSKVFALLGDRYAEAIVVATMQGAKNALDLVHALGIPTAACYRRLKELCDARLIEVVGFGPGANGKTTRVYRARVRRITYDVSEGGILLVLQYCDGQRRRIATQQGRTFPDGWR